MVERPPPKRKVVGSSPMLVGIMVDVWVSSPFWSFFVHFPPFYTPLPSGIGPRGDFLNCGQSRGKIHENTPSIR